MQVPMLLAAAPLLPRERLVLDLHSAMPLAPSVTGASGLASVTIAFAGLPALRGLQLVAQAAVMESQGPAFGFALSAGRLLGLGD